MDKKISNVSIDELIFELSHILTDNAYEPIWEDVRESITLLSKIAEFSPSKHKVAINPYLYEYEPVGLGDSYAIKKYIGFEENTIGIPDTYEGKPITTILAGAFKNCTFLKSVRLNERITTIGSSAFEGCSNLEELHGTANLRYIGEKAFNQCAALSEIGMLSQLRYLGKEAFAKTALSSFVVPKGIKFLCYKTFAECKKLRTVTLHNDLQMIGRYCFADCRELQTIEIPYSISYVGSEAFINCTSLMDLSVFASKCVWSENVFARTSIWQPDLRYNPRTIYHPMSNITIHCFPGASIHAYCNDNKLKCVRLDGTPCGKIENPMTLDTIVGFSLSEPRHPEIKRFQERLIGYLRKYEVITEHLCSQYTDYRYFDIRIINGHLDDIEGFGEYMTGCSRTQRRFNESEIKRRNDYQYLISKNSIRIKNELNMI